MANLHHTSSFHRPEHLAGVGAKHASRAIGAKDTSEPGSPGAKQNPTPKQRQDAALQAAEEFGDELERAHAASQAEGVPGTTPRVDFSSSDSEPAPPSVFHPNFYSNVRGYYFSHMIWFCYLERDAKAEYTEHK